MNGVYEKLKKCYEIVQAKTKLRPKVALILGSGLGGYAEEIDIETTVDYKEIEGFPVSTVPGHHGRFIFGRVRGVPAVIMQGRVHYYEGYSISDVVMPVRLMGLLGAGTVFLTNAAGAINRSYSAGDFIHSKLL